MGEAVEIVEVGPRDGLQNEPGFIPTEDKVRLVDALSAAGFARIEPASFVSPRWVPQMADSGEVMARIRRPPGVEWIALAPNEKGLERAIAAGVHWVAVFGSASEGFSRANINCSIAESFERFRPVVERAKAEGLKVRGYVSCVIACPHDGPVAPEAVARVSAALLEMGCDEISLGDTIGAGTPESVDAMLEAVLDVADAGRLAGHFHDTGGRALENITASLMRGVRVFDAAVGGLGGCPYAPGAPGNVATEAVAAHLAALGYEHGLDMATLEEAATLARSLRARARAEGARAARAGEGGNTD